MSSNFNNAKIINVYYNKGDRKPYDVMGKPIAYIGEEFVGSNEGSEIRFFFGEDLDSATPMIIAKRPDGQTHLDLCEKEGTGANSYYKVVLNDWYAEVKGKLTIIFKVYNGTVTFNEGNTEILSASGQVIVSDIFNLDVGYAPLATSAVPPYDPDPEASWYFALSQKLDKAQSITVTGALPTLTGGVYDDRYFYVEDEGVGRLYYINGSTAIEVVFGIGQINFATTNVPTATLTAGQMRYNDTTGSLDLGLKGDHILKVGETVVKRVRNDEAVSLKVGQMVYVSGSVGNSGLLLVKKADNTGEATSSKTFGMVATAMNTTSTKDGYVYIYGLLQGIDLTDTDISESVFSSGDVGAGLWLGENGKITKTLPTADNKHSVFIGYLDTYGGAGSNCSIYVKIQNGYELGELHDVRVSAIADNQILRYNSTRQVWENTNELTTAESNIANLQGRMTTEEANVDNLQGRMTTAESNIINIEDGTTAVGRAIADENGDDITSTYLKQVNASATYIPLSQKGANNGVVPLNSNGKISSQYLSGEQDDYIEFADLASFPLVGEADIIYCAIDTGLIYRWTGSTYAVISPSLALGTTATTAYRGDLGQNAFDNANTALDNTENIIDGTQTLSNTKFTGNIGIGTTSPATTLTVGGTGANGIQLATTTGDGSLSQRLFFSNSTATNTIVRESTALQFRTGANIGSSSGTIRMVMTDDGRVGIGSTSPTHPLHISLASGDVYAKVQSVGGSTLLGTRSDGNSVLFNDTNDKPLTFWTTVGGSSTEKMRLLANGRLGIGTTSPEQLLHIAGAINLHSQITWFNGNADINGADTNLKFRTYNGTALTEYMRLTSAGNLGIGSSSPSTKLEVAGGIIKLFESGNTALKTYSSSAGGFLASYQSDAGSPFTKTLDIVSNGDGTVPSNMRFLTKADGSSNPSERMRILANGNVGIGTASPAVRLHVAGGTRITGQLNVMGDAETKRVWIDYDDALDLASIQAIQDGVDYKNITLQAQGGRIGVGTSTNLDEVLTVNGTMASPISLARNGGTDANNSIRYKMATESWYAGVGTNKDFAFRFNSGDLANSPSLAIKTTGRVGINTNAPGSQLQVNSGNTTLVPLIVDTVASHTANLQEWRINNVIQARIDPTFGIYASALRNITSGLNASVIVGDTGTTIQRSVADTNPALIVNLANASATGNIQVWQKAGSAKSYMDNRGVYYFNETKLTLSEPTFTDLGGGVFEYNITEAQINANDVIELTKTASAINQTYKVKVPNNSKHIRIWVRILPSSYSGVVGGVEITKVANEFVKYVFNESQAESVTLLKGDTVNNIFYNMSNSTRSFIYENTNGTQKSLTAVYESEI